MLITTNDLNQNSTELGSPCYSKVNALKNKDRCTLKKIIFVYDIELKMVNGPLWQKHWNSDVAVTWKRNGGQQNEVITRCKKDIIDKSIYRLDGACQSRWVPNMRSILRLL